MQEEIWKPVIGFEGYYEVSNYGRVRSVERYVKQGNHLRYVPPKIKREAIGACGYPMVTLCKNRKSQQFRVHRLIAEAFIPNPEGKPFVDHIDTDVTNYNIENLRWVTAKENANNRLTLVHCKRNTYTTERTKKILATKAQRKCKSAPVKVYQYTKEGEYVAEYDSIAEAMRSFGKNVGINRVLNDNTQSAGGYMWFTEKRIAPKYKRRKSKLEPKGILYCDKEGNIIAKYDSVSEAARETRVLASNIRRSIHSNNRARKYKFKLLE